MLLGALSSTLLTGWRSLLLVWRPFDSWVHPPASSCADKAVGNCDHSDNSNAAAPSSWKRDQDAMRLSSVSEMFPTAVIYVFRADDSLGVVCRFWLPCHISKKSWTLAILCNLLVSASRFNSKSLSVSNLSNLWSSPANIPSLVQAYCLTTTFSWRVSAVVFDCLLPTTSRSREKLPSTPITSGMMDNMSRATFERSAYVARVSECYGNHSSISGIQNVLPISIGLEW